MLKGGCLVKKRIGLVVAVLLAVALSSTGVLSANLALNAPVIVCFTPGDDCTDLIVDRIGMARSEILVQAYSFTSAPIAKAFIDAHKRGVRVQVILDKSQETAKYSSATFLANVRVPTYIDRKHAIAHNKIIIIDGETVFTGSFNFTKAAQEKNAENLIVIKSKHLAAVYIGNWQVHRAHSNPYQERY